MKFLLLCLFLLLSCNREPKHGGDFSVGNFESASQRGKVQFVFFGFLHCPHVCPTTTSAMNVMLKGLSAEEKKSISAVFITVDPERDTPSVMKDYFSDKDSAFIPVSGKPEEVKTALSKFGGSFNIVKGLDVTDVFVDHTSTIFVINKSGTWVNSLPYDASPEEMRDALQSADTLPPYWEDEETGPVKSLGVNQDCDAGLVKCSVKGIETEFSTYPVRHLMTSTLTLKMADPDLIPVRASFIGVEQEMGLIRPRFIKDSSGKWMAKFQLPPCNLTGMHWNLKVLLKDHGTKMYEARFHLSSINSL